MGLGRADRNVQRPVPDAERARARAGVADAVHARSSRSRPWPVDPTSDQKSEQLPTYNAYSIDGDVTGPLVYVNYGRPEDYEELERYGVSVKGAIVIARYGESWRGIKPKVAAEHGAIGCLIYSDPKDDGYAAARCFPTARCGRPTACSAAACMDMPMYPGDPLTPGVGATPGAKRLAIKDAPTLTKIPVLPISYADAQPLLAALDRRRSRPPTGAAACRSRTASAPAAAART